VAAGADAVAVDAAAAKAAPTPRMDRGIPATEIRAIVPARIVRVPIAAPTWGVLRPPMAKHAVVSTWLRRPRRPTRRVWRQRRRMV
jgi:hypothetical protein